MAEGTPYTDDALRESGNDIYPDDLQEFVIRRTKNPVVVNEVTVYNFSNHEVDKEQLEEQTDELIADKYLIPYSVEGIWGYMVLLLPERIRDLEILAYNQKRGEYNPYPNLIRHSNENDNEATRRVIEEQL